MAFLNLKAILGLDGTGFRVGLKQAESLSMQFSARFKQEMAAAFGTAALVAYGKSVVEAADRILDLSDRLDVSTQTLQEWEYALKKNGVAVDELASFFERLSVSRDEALSGNQKTIESFKALGVTMDDLKKKRIEDIAKLIGNKVQGSDTQNIISQLRDIGGKSAGSLIPVFKDGLDELAQAAHNAGQALDNETLLALKEIKIEAQNIANIFKGPVATIIVFIAKRIEDMMDVLSIGSKGLGAFFGALSGGASFSDAMKAFENAGDEVLSARAKREKARQDAISERDKPKYNPNRFEEVTKEQSDKAKKLFDLQRQNKLDRMSPEQRISALISERNRLSGATDIDSQIRVAELDKEIAGAGYKLARGGNEPQVNALQKIGAQVLGVSGADRALTELQKIEKNTRDIGKRNPATADLGRLLDGNFGGGFGG